MSERFCKRGGGVTIKKRCHGKPGLVKISFQSTEEKIEVLRRKRDLCLREVDVYKSVFLKSSKSHTERLIELNTKSLSVLTLMTRPIQPILTWLRIQCSNLPGPFSQLSLVISMSAAGLWRIGNSENK